MKIAISLQNTISRILSKKMESSKGNSRAKINHSDLVIRRVSQLLKSDIAFDVVFIVEGQRLGAHKCIFAAGNKYFENLFYSKLSDPKQKEFELKEVPLEAFKAILEYIYSGQMCLLEMEDHIVDILRLARMYNFEQLERDIIIYLEQIIAVSNVWPIFELAWLCDMEHLKDICNAFMDKNALDVLAHESFSQISKRTLKDVLSRNSFLAPEIEIFSAVNEWCKQHEEVDVDSVLSCVRLPLISVVELIKLRKAGILKEETFLGALETKTSSKKLPYRVWPKTNMATFEFGARIIGGSWETHPRPPGNIFPYSGVDKSEIPAILRAKIYEGIVVELGITSVINHIRFLNGKAGFSYFVEVSHNQSKWERIVNYQGCDCNNWQELYFHPKYVKYIKIVGTAKMGLKMKALIATFELIILKQISGFITATLEINGIRKDRPTCVENKAPLFHNYQEDMDQNNISRHLHQPYLVSSMRIFFSELLHAVYDYSIEVSIDGTEWSTVKSKRNENAISWQNISFPPRPVVYIKICSNRAFTNCYGIYICPEEEQYDNGYESESDE